jgi:tetratricopeptide (TPR) repeat protein
MDAGQGRPTTPSSASPVGRLDSWKAVATHFGRDVRTVQRWERDEGLPVHRHVHLKRGSIHAYAHELDEWWRQRERDAPGEADRQLADRSGGGRRRIRAAMVTGIVVAGLVLGAITWKFRTEAAPRARLDPATHELIARGHHHLDQFTPDGARRAITAFSAAVVRSPGSAEAHAGLAMAHMWAVARSPETPRHHYEIARRAAEAAVRLDPADADCQAAAGLVAAFRRDWTRAVAAYEHALAVTPDNGQIRAWHAMSLGHLGRFEEALEEIRYARRLQPLSLPIHAQEGWILLWADRTHEAIDQWQRTLQLDANFPLAHYNLGLGYTRLGLHGRAIAEFGRALALVPGRVAYIAQLAAAHARDGNRDEALRLLSDLEARASREYVPAFHLAILHAALNHHDTAIEELERAEHEYEPALANLLVEPFWFTSIAHDARFQALQRRVRQPIP